MKTLFYSAPSDLFLRCVSTISAFLIALFFLPHHLLYIPAALIISLVVGFVLSELMPETNKKPYLIGMLSSFGGFIMFRVYADLLYGMASGHDVAREINGKDPVKEVIWSLAFVSVLAFTGTLLVLFSWMSISRSKEHYRYSSLPLLFMSLAWLISPVAAFMFRIEVD